MKPCLVVYYSRSGRTRAVASALAQACHADLEELQPAGGGRIGYLHAIYLALSGAIPPLEPLRHDPVDYQLTIVGTPVWAGRMAAPVRSYLYAQRERFHQLAAFCTMGGSGGGQVLSSIGLLARQRLAGSLALTARQLASNEHAIAVQQLARDLEAAVKPLSTAS